MSYSCVERRKAWDEFLANAKREMKGSHVKIGFPENGKVASPLRKGSGHKPITKMSDMAMIAAVHEFGNEAGTIPARTYFRLALLKMQSAIPRMLDKAGIEMLVRGITAEKALSTVGDTVAKGIQHEIRQLKTPPLKKKTIKKKGSSKLLIDREQMINTVQYQVVK